MLPLHSPTEDLVEVEFAWTGSLPCPMRPSLSMQDSFPSTCNSLSRRSYRPTLTPGDYLVHAFGQAAVHDTLLDLRQMAGESPSTTPNTENDEDDLSASTTDAEGGIRTRKSKNSRRYKYPKAPPKGTFSSAVAHSQDEASSLSWPLLFHSPPEKHRAIQEETHSEPSPIPKDPTTLSALEYALEKELDSVRDASREGVETSSTKWHSRRHRRRSESRNCEVDENTASREPPMSTVEWRVKAEERLERRKLRRVQFAFEGSGPNLQSSPLPFGIDCRPMTASFGLAPPVQFAVPRVPRKRGRTISDDLLARIRDSGEEKTKKEEKNSQGEKEERISLGRSRSLSAIDCLAKQCASFHIDPAPD